MSSTNRATPKSGPARRLGHQRLASASHALRPTEAAEGGMADVAKPMKGFGSGVFEVALGPRGDAFHVLYAEQLADAVWVVQAFQKKSKTGIKSLASAA